MSQALRLASKRYHLKPGKHRRWLERAFTQPA
jgi:hypothetical protein